MEYPLYNQSGESVGKVNLPDNVFGLPMNKDLLYQVVNSLMANKRQVIAHAKGRSEVSGGGVKPWRQKGTGRARHGSIRSPIWRHGGVSFGPRNTTDFSQKVNKKVMKKALWEALAKKYSLNQLKVIKDLEV